MASDSEKNLKKDVPEKHVFLGERQSARLGAMRPSKSSRDVKPRRPDGAFLKGKLKAGRQKAPHLGPGLEPKIGTSDIRDQNYLYAHLLKGGLYSIRFAKPGGPVEGFPGLLHMVLMIYAFVFLQLPGFAFICRFRCSFFPPHFSYVFNFERKLFDCLGI